MLDKNQAFNYNYKRGFYLGEKEASDEVRNIGMDDEKHQPTFQNLSLEELLAIDEAVGPVLDNGFGTVELKFEYTRLRWITKTIPVKVTPFKAA